MAKQYIQLGNMIFEVLKPSTYIPKSEGQLEDCYTKPSKIKKSIMNDWWFWANSISGTVKIWVTSFNYRFFSLGGEMWDETNKHYAFYITYKRQQIWEVID